MRKIYKSVFAKPNHNEITDVTEFDYYSSTLCVVFENLLYFEEYVPTMEELSFDKNKSYTIVHFVNGISRIVEVPFNTFNDDYGVYERSKFCYSN